MLVAESSPGTFIFLSGFMGTGKSTVGPLLATRLARPFLDLDVLVVARAGRVIADIFRQAGEAEFRRMETEALHSLLRGPGSVVALGGGTVLSPENRAKLSAHGTLITLTAELHETVRRLGNDNRRPLGDGTATEVAALRCVRAAVYADCDLTWATDGLEPAEVADQLVAALRSGISAP